MRRIAIAVFVSALLLPAGADAEHGSVPAWPPKTNANPVATMGSDGSLCGLHTVDADFGEITVDLFASETRGTVSASTTLVCRAGSYLHLTIVSAVYRQRGTGLADTGTIGAVDTARLSLVGANTCRFVVFDAPRVLSCETPYFRYANGPGTRLVVTSGVTFDLPAGRAWVVSNPVACRRIGAASRHYCFLAADLRG